MGNIFFLITTPKRDVPTIITHNKARRKISERLTIWQFPFPFFPRTILLHTDVNIVIPPAKRNAARKRNAKFSYTPRLINGVCNSPDFNHQTSSLFPSSFIFLVLRPTLICNRELLFIQTRWALRRALFWCWQPTRSHSKLLFRIIVAMNIEVATKQKKNVEKTEK